MYRREFLEATGTTAAAVPLAGEEKSAEEKEEKTTGVLSITVEDGALGLDGYPFGDMEEGEVHLSTIQGDVHLGIASKGDRDQIAEALFSFDPETAEEVGDMLHEFAEKARDGEGWVYP